MSPVRQLGGWRTNGGQGEVDIPATLTVAGKWRTMCHGFKISSLKPPEDST